MEWLFKALDELDDIVTALRYSMGRRLGRARRAARRTVADEPTVREPLKQRALG